MSRRVLVIAHPFPPAGGGGVQRTAKLTKYLPDFGWRATVLTTQAELYPRLMGVEDRALLAEVEGQVEIVRVPSPEAVPLPAPLSRALRRIALPDPAALWNPGALVAGLRLHAERPFSLLYATGNPYSSYLLARELSRLVRRPYVLDMRDAWRLRDNRRPSGRLGLSEARLARMEAQVLGGAGHVVFATAPMEARYLEHYPTLGGRTSTILNGFDDADYPARDNPYPLRGPEDPVVFLHSGTWTDYVRPDTLLEGFRRARDADAAFRRRARLEMMGRWGTRPEETSALDALLDRLGLREVFTHHGYRSHPEAVLAQRTADALMLATSGLPDEQQAKTAEYLAAGRPVVALVDPGVPAEALIREAAHAELAPSKDPEAASRAFLRVFAAADARRVGPVLPPPPPAALPFTRKAAAERVATIFDRLAAG